MDIKTRVQSVTGSNSINVTTDINKNVQIEAKIKSGDNKLSVDNDGMFVAPYDSELDSESTNAVENKVLKNWKIIHLAMRLYMRKFCLI